MSINLLTWLGWTYSGWRRRKLSCWASQEREEECSRCSFLLANSSWNTRSSSSTGVLHSLEGFHSLIWFPVESLLSWSVSFYYHLKCGVWKRQLFEASREILATVCLLSLSSLLVSGKFIYIQMAMREIRERGNMTYEHLLILRAMIILWK